jgi:GxxExxY protein
MENRYDLAGKVIGLAMIIHTTLGPGFLESVYRNALAYELRLAGFKVELEKAITVYYRQQVVGNFVADMIVNEQLIVELKAVQNLTSAHGVQLVNYLTATGIEEGLLLNFGATSLEYRKKFRTFKPKAATESQ